MSEGKEAEGWEEGRPRIEAERYELASGNVAKRRSDEWVPGWVGVGPGADGRRLRGTGEENSGQGEAMSWSVGYDTRWGRDVGYGVPAYCDEPGCDAEIDRGLAYVCCGQKPYGGDEGCGLYFCEKHRGGGSCNHKGYSAKPDHPKWTQHKLTDPSWQEWRDSQAKGKESSE